ADLRAHRQRRGDQGRPAGRDRGHDRGPAAVPLSGRDPDRRRRAGRPRRRRARSPHPPAPGGRSLERRARAGPDRAARGSGPMTITPASVIRLALLGLLGGILQLSAVSQITVFGVPADLTPLLVASAGFIAGSIPGAVFGFCLGLFVDISLYQTLGVS